MSLRSINNCFEDILKKMQTNKQLDDYFEDLKYIEENSITLLMSPKKRQVFDVKDEPKGKTQPDRYFCTVDPNYCSCDAFRIGVLSDSLSLCEHLIASKISKALNNYRVMAVTDKQIDRFWLKHVIN